MAARSWTNLANTLLSSSAAMGGYFDTRFSPLGILIIITFSVPHVHWDLVWGQVDRGLPGLLTLIMNLSKCSHFVERWPRMQGSLEMLDKQKALLVGGLR